MLRGRAFEGVQLKLSETWKHLMDRNNKAVHLCIQHSFLKAGDVQGGCRMTKERKTTATYHCSPLWLGQGERMVPAFWSWVACAMFWLCHLPAVTLDGYQSFSVLLFLYPGDPRAVRSIT